MSNWFGKREAGDNGAVSDAPLSRILRFRTFFRGVHLFLSVVDLAWWGHGIPSEAKAIPLTNNIEARKAFHILHLIFYISQAS
jgi:hypothetical protein